MPPFRKRFSKRSYGRSRSSSRRRRPMGGSFMKRARTRAYANLRTGGLLAIERKFSDLAYVETALGVAGGSGAAVNGGSPTGQSDYAPGIVGPGLYRTATGLIYSVNHTALNVLGPGDSGSDRDGRQVINDSIHLRGMVSYGASNVTSTDPSTCVNIVLVLDTQTNGGAPGGGAVFVNPGDTNSGSARFAPGSCPFVNLANSKRFRILKHIRRLLVPSAVAQVDSTHAYAAGSFIFAMDIPLKGMKTNYVADTAVTSATVASIGDNGLFLFAWCDVAGVCYLNYNSRLRFRG